MEARVFELVDGGDCVVFDPIDEFPLASETIG
jgi:hypothetical protein